MKLILKTFSMTHKTLAGLYSSVDAINQMTPQEIVQFLCYPAFHLYTGRLK